MTHFPKKSYEENTNYHTRGINRADGMTIRGIN